MDEYGVPDLALNDGRTIPAIGFGTYPLRGNDGVAVLRDAITAGYRLIDSAARYQNEAEVGRAVAESGVPRDSLFVTTKLPGAAHGHDETLRAFEQSLSRLGLDYVDLYLIHWPLPRVDRYSESWRAFVELRDQGLVHSIGVSNFTPDHLERLVREVGVVPAVNQIELHPRFAQADQRAYDAKHQIVTQSWSPLGRGSDLLENSVVVQVADAHQVTPAQVVLRWHHQIGVVPIPKSGNAIRLRQNLDVFSFRLMDDEMDALASIETGVRIGGDPAQHEEF